MYNRIQLLRRLILLGEIGDIRIVRDYERKGFRDRSNILNASFVMSADLPIIEALVEKRLKYA